MIAGYKYKDPDEVEIFSFYWGKKLNAGAVVQGTNTWSASPNTLTIASETIVEGGQYTSAKISGGTANTDYVITNRITTSDGETLEESGRLRVKASDAT